MSALSCLTVKFDLCIIIYYYKTQRAWPARASWSCPYVILIGLATLDGSGGKQDGPKKSEKMAPQCSKYIKNVIFF